MNPADRYHLVVYRSDEDQCYVGLCPDLFYGGTHGDDPEQVFKDLRTDVADVVESYKAEVKRLPEPRDWSQHNRLCGAAVPHGIHINSK